MASTQKKTTNNSASGGKKSTGTKNAGKTGTAAKKTESGKKKEPVRANPAVYTPNLVARGVGAAVCLFVAVLLVLSMTGTSAVVVDLLGKGVRGLVGYGIWLAIPALAAAAVILLAVRQKRVTGRMWCLGLLPVVFGAFLHMICSPYPYDMGLGAFSALWRDGINRLSGGVLGGFLGISFSTWFSKIGAGIIFVLVMLFLLAGAFHLTPAKILAWSRERRERAEALDNNYDYEEYDDGYYDRYEPGNYDYGPREDDFAPVVPVTAGRTGTRTASKPALFGRKKAPDVPLDEPRPKDKPAADAKADRTKEAGGAKARKADRPAPQRPAEPVPEEQPAEKPRTKAEEKAAQRRETEQVTQDIEAGLRQESAQYRFPSLDLLTAPSGKTAQAAHQEVEGTLERLASVLVSFGIDGHVTGAVQGPSVTRYDVALEQGVRLNKLTNLSDDVALALGVSSVRIAPVPGKISVVGIEVPNKVVTPVPVREVLDSRDFKQHKSTVAFSVGKDIGGNYIVGDCGKLPHVLIAGTTGSGKSVCINSLIVSLLYKSTPEEVRLIMVDPKVVELAVYNGIPHLLIPVVTDPKKAAGALQWAVVEMMRRYRVMAEAGVRELSSYNQWAKGQENLEPIPKIVIIIDEMADMMMVAGKEAEESIVRIAQMGRAAGVHLVLATQRPSADVITGLMKSNIPSRIAFAVASSLDSRIILDITGAEKLVGKGDMLWYPLGLDKPLRVQGCFISDEEVSAVVDSVKANCAAEYDDTVMEQIEQHAAESGKGKGGAYPAGEGPGEEKDELFDAGVDVVLDLGQASASMLQRRLKLGYARAARLLDQMEQQGIVGPSEGAKPRQILITKEQWAQMQAGGGDAPVEEVPPAVEDEILTFDPVPQTFHETE